MCGIVGIVGREPVAGHMVEALKRLEYRGYDSAGVATLENGHLARRRAEGKLRNLEKRLAGEPLSGAIGYGDGEMFLGSDAIALAPFTDAVSYLEEGDWVVVTRSGADVRNAEGVPVKRAVIKSNASAFLVDKGNHRHFMAKEIHEQPEVVGHTLAHYLDMGNERVSLPMKLPFGFKKIERLAISACGPAYYAGLVAKYRVQPCARLP